MKNVIIKIHEPFAEFLLATSEEHTFELSLLDAVRFAGHACPSMVGAFMISQHVVSQLFPESNVCERGDVAIDIRTDPTDGATGPISNVFSFVFGAFEKTGFGGLGGKDFSRRNLLKYNVADVPSGAYRFRRLSTQKSLLVHYSPGKAQVTIDPSWSFQKQWRTKIDHIARHPEEVIWSELCV